VRPPANLHRHRSGEANSDRACDRARQDQRPDLRKLPAAPVAQQCPAEIHEAPVGGEQRHDLCPARAGDTDLALQHRRGRLDARDRPHALDRALVEAVRVARDELQLRVADEPVRQLRDGGAETRAGDLAREQQRDPDRDPDHGEQLLHGTRGDAAPVEPQEAARAQRASNVGSTARSSSANARSRPSRSV
jgi:hypothetical protein